MNKITTISTLSLLLTFGTSTTFAQVNSSWASPTDGGNWSDAANWTNGEPSSRDDNATLGNATSNRTVTWDSDGPFRVNSLTFTQTSSANNILQLRRKSAVSQQIQLGASGGGNTIMDITSSTANFTGAEWVFNAEGGMSINSGGVMRFSKIRNNNDTNQTQTQLISNNENIEINGGSLIFYNATTTKANTAVVNYTLGSINAAFVMNSGLIEIGAQGFTSGDTITESNFRFTGEVNLNGGTLKVHLYDPTSSARFFSQNDTMTLGGELLLDVSNMTGNGDYQIVAANDANLAGDFDTVALSGGGSFSSDGEGIWSLDDGEHSYSFSANTGVLSVGASIPEASSVGMLGALAALVFVFEVRRRKSKA